MLFLLPGTPFSRWVLAESFPCGKFCSATDFCQGPSWTTGFHIPFPAPHPRPRQDGPLSPASVFQGIAANRYVPIPRLERRVHRAEPSPGHPSPLRRTGTREVPSKCHRLKKTARRWVWGPKVREWGTGLHSFIQCIHATVFIEQLLRAGTVLGTGGLSRPDDVLSF